MRSSIQNHITKPEEGTGYKLIDIDAIAYLVEDYKISSEWLILGMCGIFNNRKAVQLGSTRL